jgi:hypothetical protein
LSTGDFAAALHRPRRRSDFREGTSFRERRLEDLIAAKKWDWPRHPTGRLQLAGKVIAQQAKRYPELRPLVKLRDTIAELRISKLVNTIGADGFSRCPMLPFWTRTSRCQPSAADKVFLPSLPAWLHGVLAPPKDHVLIELDWDAQEVAIMAGLSGDPAMIDDYQNGDPHGHGVRAGFGLPGRTRTTIRNCATSRSPAVLGPITE